MSSRIKGYVFEVVVSHAPPSVVLADQMNSLDWRTPGASSKDAVPPNVLTEVQDKVRVLLRL